MPAVVVVVVVVVKEPANKFPGARQEEENPPLYIALGFSV